MKLRFANSSSILHSCNGVNNDVINFEVRLLNNRLQYSIMDYSLYNTFSIYDGNNFDDAFEQYIDIVKRQNNISEANNIARQKQNFYIMANKLLLNTAEYMIRERSRLYKKQPLFLGINDPC